MTIRNRWEENGSQDQNQVSHIQEGGSWKVADGKGAKRHLLCHSFSPFSSPSSPPKHLFVGYPLDLAIGCLDLLYGHSCEHACLSNTSILLSKPGPFFLPFSKSNPVLGTKLALSDLKPYLRVIHKDHIPNCNHTAMTFSIPLGPHSIYIDKDITEHYIEQ